MPVVSVDPGSRRHEGGKTLIVIGGLLFVYLLIVMCWVGWDIRAGNWFMQASFAAVAVIALVLILVGMGMKHRASI